MPSVDDHNIPAIITTDLTADDDDRAPPPLTTSPVQTLSPTGPGFLSPYSPAVGPRGSLDVPSSPTHTDDGASIITVPPSPTLSSHSSVHFHATSLALRGNNPELRSPSLLSPLDGNRNTHQRKGSNATFASDVTEADTSPRPEEELRHVKSNTTSLTHVGSRSVSRAKRDTADSDTATAISEKATRRKKGAGPQEPPELDTDADPTPFRFRANELAMLLDPKNLDALEDMGGIDGLLDGLGTTVDMGLGGPSLERSTTGLSSRGDGRPGAGVGVSHRHDPEKVEEPVPAITLTDPEGENSTNWTSTGAFAASLDVRKHIYGENVLPHRATKSLLSLMYTALKDKVLVLLSIAAVVSLALGLFQDFGTPRPADNPPRVDWVEGVAIMVAILIVVVVGSVNDWQKERQFQTLNDKKEERGVKVIRGGVETVIDIKQVVVGDIALLEPGEIVPCDGVFLSGHNVKCDESGATGESDAIKKVSYDECIVLRGSDGGAHTDCFVVSGSKVLEGVGKYVVVAVGTKSFNGRIMMALRGDADNTPLQIKLNDLAELIAKLGSAAGLILFTALLIRFFVQLGTNEPVRTANQKGIAFVNILIISVTLIVVAVPEGLPLAVTLALAFATKRMTYEKLLVRILRSCETMANASVVCTNKTGTLTQNVMTVVAGSVGVHAKFVRHLEANTTRTDANDPGVRKHVNDFSLDLSQLNSALSPQLQELFNEAIAVNSTAFQDKSPETGELIFVGSKTETALLQFAQELQWPDFRATRDDATVVQVIPFSSERKAMGVVVRTPRGNFRLYLKGASEILSKKCSQYVVVHKEGPGSRAPTEDIETSMIDEHANDNITRTTIFYANQMLRTIALCYRDLDSWPPRDAVHDEQNEASYDDLAQDLTLIGIVGIEDPLRPGVLEAVKNCQMAGVTVKLCTGDNVLTARSIATQCGIFSHGGIIMEGPVFRELSLEEKIEIVPRLQVLARSSPKDKEVLVETLKHIGEIVGVTGDGTNDGPALKTANVGFSMGIAGTEVAKEASDIILMDDNFASIVKAIMWGRCVNDAVRKFLQFQVSTNITAIVITFVSAVASVEESSVLSAVQLLWIHIIMDTFAALALATDPASESLLNRKPDKKTAPLFSTEMYKQILFQSTYQIIITLVFHFAGLEILGFGHSQDAKTVKNDLVLQTLVFNVFVFTQIFNSVNCRRLDRKLNIFEGILKNWYFIAIMLIEICFQVLIVNIGGAAFKVTPIGVREWGISLASGVVSMPLGAVVRLLPNNPFERLFKMLGLLPHPDVLPTTNPNPDTVEWNATTRVRDNLNTFATVRGGRIGSSSFVIKNRWARPSEEQVHPETLPNPMIGTINGTHSWTPPGFLPDPTHLDSSRSAVLWEGKTPLHPDTSAKDPPSERLGGDQRDRRSAFVTDVLTQPERQDQGGVSSRSRRRSAATRRSRSTSQSSIQHSYGESASSINSQLPSGHSHHSESYDQHLASLLRDLDLTGKVERLGKYPFESGSLADIYTATLKYSKDPVAVKIFRRIHYDPQTLQRTSTFLCEEAKTWSRLHHPNVLSFLGIAGNLGLSPAIVTPLCTAGPITTYIRQTQPGTKERFKMIIGVAKGLSCLHSKNILHGNLCTKKVLISGDAFPVISGYGIFKVLHHPHLFSPRFSSPELFSNDGASADRTKSGDVYAFAMVALEILSGLQPYHHLSNDYAVVKHVFQGGRPVRQQLDQTAVPKSMWKLLSSLWIENPKSRPEMAYVLQTLTQMEDAIDDELDCSSVESGKPKSGSENSSSSGEEASFEDPSLPDVNGQNLKGRVIQEGHFPFARGGNSNIYRGKFTRSDGRKIRVAIKMILFDDGSGQSDEALRRLKREAEIWAQLKHKHLVPFIGVCDDVAPWPVLVSPFYKLGHVGAFLGNNPAANRPNIVVGVTSGLEYLHANGIVHGDLKVSNVLVDKRGIPYICDFGISKILSRSGYTTSSVGTCPYMAPELFIVLDGTFDPEIRPSTTKSSDVYSFALLALEILTSEPLKARPTRQFIKPEKLSELRPKRADYITVVDEAWSVLDPCWEFDPKSRPTISDVQNQLPLAFNGAMDAIEAAPATPCVKSLQV